MKGSLSTVDLLVLSSLDWMLLISKTLFTFYQTSYLNEEANHTEPVQLEIPAQRSLMVHLHWRSLSVKTSVI